MSPYDCFKLRAPEDEPGYCADEEQELDDDPSTRECEGCGQQKPIEEMQTCFLPGTGETYQCEQCRGLPTGGSSGCAAPNCEEG